MAADPRFFLQAGPQSLAALLDAAGASSPGDPARRFVGVARLQDATEDQVSFLDNRRYLDALTSTRAGAVVLAEAFVAQAPPGCVPIVAKAPYLAFARIAALFHPAPAPLPGIHPSAVVDPSARIGEGTEIAPLAVVGAGAEIGPRCLIGPHAVIGPGVMLGEGCRIHAHASVSHALLGRAVVLHPGARIGQEGFGFAPTPDGRYVTMPQLGRVILEDGVEIGANACVDRGSQGDTVIGAGTRVDNLVQLAHNVRTGRGCVLASQVGISGSTTLGEFVQAAGQVGMTGHLVIGRGARIGAQAGVINDVSPGVELFGTPALPVKEAFRQVAVLKRMSARSRGGKGEGG
ncbi:UDP-3-O-(3-hydroxymyristoyl)glucosamine N-acyltransferase [Sabulicella glaciei]|uniref:UDP-3-O-acylglucosamine N-acyltransferase n=1 Tax=Sabulicella glaciei TaxID=2984948 RepID=A0ABT3NPJ8_9PROT|nr:UDP-3-O-(3-hydroxymyristoyl)glucosamine N-acyltransferase [Roseococcus sp. MDT2-1-1]MCW8084087.1 UDP-3-O-(3-hydroxymyristoyl)glucosamine N-acyltransferase [Roseococcus sp. MDT2-1-1]